MRPETIENKSREVKMSFPNTHRFSWASLVVVLLAFLLPCQLSHADQPGFTDLGAITNNDTPDERPHAVADGRGNWVMVWHGKSAAAPDYDIYVSSSLDNGATWTPAKPLNTNAGSDSGNDEYPRLATDKQGNWVVVWHSRGVFGTDYDILVSRSTDNGVTWSAKLPRITQISLISYLYPEATGKGRQKSRIFPSTPT